MSGRSSEEVPEVLSRSGKLQTFLPNAIIDRLVMSFLDPMMLLCRAAVFKLVSMFRKEQQKLKK